MGLETSYRGVRRIGAKLGKLREKNIHVANVTQEGSKPPQSLSQTPSLLARNE